jgi:acyl-homoserine-lactone acylase
MIRKQMFYLRPQCIVVSLLSVLFLHVINVKAQDLSQQVVVRRTQYGVPHIYAKNIEAAGYAMGYLQMQDYGKYVTSRLIKARGEWAKYHKLRGKALKKWINEDAVNHLLYARAVKNYRLLNKETQNMLKGFAKGVNRYIELHSEKFPQWVKSDFTVYDIHARQLEVVGNSKAAVRKFIRAQKRKGIKKESYDGSNPWSYLALHSKDRNRLQLASNAWALAPSRTTSGKAILLRNPHLSWRAGYYEAQMKVAGKFNYYGDFRIGEPLGLVGGFNRYLGWATTNNNPDRAVIYALAIDPDNPNHYLLDGTSFPLIKKKINVEYKTEDGIKTKTNTFLSTPFGRVIYRTENKIYIIKSTTKREYLQGEQFLRMMEAKNLEQWKDAMKIQGKTNSNFIYADGKGNIFYVWNAAIPALNNYKQVNDTTAIFVTKSSEIWINSYPWERLPHLLNPKGGYIQNENNPFYYTNMNEVFDESNFPANFPKPSLGLRSQLAIQLIGGGDKLSLKNVINRKYNMSMLLADRVKVDLIQAVEHSRPSGEIKKALKILKKWNNTVAKNSKGGILFVTWWKRYVQLANRGKRVRPTPESAGFPAPAKALFAVPWTPKQPASTPYGLANKKNTVSAFKWAVQKVKEKYGTLGLKWGEIHRAIVGKYNYPVGGASGRLGCFRVIWYEHMKKNEKKLKAVGGDGWILAVEFDKIPRAYSVLAYGESLKKLSPYHGDQLKLFVNKKMKPVHYTEEDVKKNAIKVYHPGELKH